MLGCLTEVGEMGTEPEEESRFLIDRNNKNSTLAGDRPAGTWDN